MQNSIYIPERIKVGFQKRSDTYTGMLAYIIYYDNENKLRKENSWTSWRNKDIEPQEFKNEPTTGFVLNKKTGGYAGYYGNFRQAYIRVYDPRGFEFEITVPNLLFILENCSSYQGKGLDGEFVYGWDGKDLVLLPTNCADYKDLSEKSKKINNNEFIKTKDFKVGYTYLSTNNGENIYLGKYDRYNYQGKKCSSKYHWFAYLSKGWDGQEYISIQSYVNPNKKFIKEIQGVNEKYTEAIKKLEKDSSYSPVTIVERVKLDLDLLNKCDEFHGNTFACYTKIENKSICIRFEVQDKKYYEKKCANDLCRVDFYESYHLYSWAERDERQEIYNKYLISLGYEPDKRACKMTIEDIIKYFEPEITVRKQQNGNIYTIGERI